MPQNTSNTTFRTVHISLLLAIMLAFGAMVYSNTFGSPLVFDDEIFIINDNAVHMTELSGDAIKTAAVDGRPRHRYLPNISFALNYYFGKLNPFGYHLVNLIIHLLSGIFLFFFIKNTLRVSFKNPEALIIASTLYNRWDGVYPHPKREGMKPSPKMNKTMIGAFDYKTNPDVIAFFTALIWIVQPVGTQSVTYICQRMASMVAMFYILSLLLYVKGRMAMRQTPADRIRIKPGLFFSGSFLAAFCAIATKENAGTLPLVILLYEWFFFQDLKLKWSRRQILWITFFAIVFTGVVFWYMGENPMRRIFASYNRRNFSLIERVMTEWRIVVYYISLFIWAPPGRLNLDHDYPLSLSPVHPATTMIALTAILVLFAWAAYAAKKDRLIAFAILWFFITQATESTVIGIELVFEHRTYIPFMLISLLFVVAIFRMVKNRPMAYGLLIATVLVFSAWTYQRNQIWQNPIAFWTDCAVKSPDKQRPQNNLGIALFDAGDISKAVTQYEKAIQIDPNVADAHNNLGYLFFKQGKADEAVQCFRRALALNPNYVDAINNLGNALFKQGKTNEAIQSFRRALALNPDLADAHNNLGNVLFKQGETDKAIQLFRRALALNPDLADAHNNLGNAFFKLGKIEDAFQSFYRALALNPDHIEAHNNLANMLMQNGEIQGSIDHFQVILKKKPDHVEANINMGAALARLGQIDAAVTHYQAALKSDPYNAEAHNNMGALLAQKNMFPEALDHFQRALALRPGYESAINNIRQLEQMMR